MKPVYVLSPGGPLHLKEVLGNGGEASVYKFPNNDRFVAKIYSSHEGAEAAAPRVRQLAEMSLELRQRSKAFEKRILLPRDLLLDPDTRAPLGFTMARATGSQLRTLYEWFHRKENSNPHATMQMCRYARNVAALVREVHRAGLRVADLNSTNFLAAETGAVFLIDTDSFAIPEPGTDYAKPPLNCPVGKAEFLPPELQGIPLVSAPRGEHQDRWSLAVLLFLLFARGTHPFDGTDKRGTLPTQQGARMKISGTFPYGRSPVLITPPRRGLQAWKMLPDEVRSLMTRTFVDGHQAPANRPAAEEWVEVLDQLLSLGFHYCQRQHSFPAWLNKPGDACPKCGRGLGRWSTNPAERNRPPPTRTRTSPIPRVSSGKSHARATPYAARKPVRAPASQRPTAPRHHPSHRSTPPGPASAASGSGGVGGALRSIYDVTEGAFSFLCQGVVTLGAILLRIVSYLAGFAAGIAISLTVTCIIFVVMYFAVLVHLP